jgi:hypothetical protein
LSPRAVSPQLLATEVQLDVGLERHIDNGGSLISRSLPGGDPEFFLASIDTRLWTPRIVAISNGPAVVGLMFAKERKVMGMRSGLIYADDTLGGMVAAERSLRSQVFEAGVAHLMSCKGTRGLRLLVPQSGPAVSIIQRRTQPSAQHPPMDVHYVSRSSYHPVLPLGDSYEGFLESMGKQTRRNFRYYRRRLESRGHHHVSEMSLDQFERAAKRLEGLNVIGSHRGGTPRAMRMLKAVERPVLMGLRHENGEWLSIVGGWREGDRIVVFIQMNNDQDYPEDSLCTVARACLIDTAIQQGTRELVFWAGVGLPLARYCSPVPTLDVHLDARTLFWRTTRRIVAAVSPMLSGKVAELAHWVVPARTDAPDSHAVNLAYPASMDQE